MGARRIAFINEKGGTCKTTLAVHTAAWLASERGLKVLLVDVDTQGHAGKSLGIDVRDLPMTIADVLLDDNMEPRSAVFQTALPNLDVLPSNRSAATLPELLAGFSDRHLRLRGIIDKIEEEGNYDLVVFDAPPSLGLITLSIMLAAEEIVVPVALTYFALDGCAEIVQTVEQVREDHGHKNIEVSLVVPTLYRRTRLADDVMAKLQQYFSDRLAPALGFSVKIDEAQSHGKTIWEHSPRSKGAMMLADIAEFVWEKGKKHGRKRKPSTKRRKSA